MYRCPKCGEVSSTPVCPRCNSAMRKIVDKDNIKGKCESYVKGVKSFKDKFGQRKEEFQKRAAEEQTKETIIEEKRKQFYNDKQTYTNEKQEALRKQGYSYYYEYKVIKQTDKFSGSTDILKLEEKFNLLALEGWQIKQIIANELGKSAIGAALDSVGVGVNSTTDEIIIILERKCFL